MDQLLKLIDALRERGAIKISTPEVSVEFSMPVIPVPIQEPESPVFERSIDASEIERLLYSETTKM